jgi:hypothetical protein
MTTSSIINVGTTNTDGTGSATNLSAAVATATLSGSGVYQNGVDMINAGFGSMTYAYVDVWNKLGYKEVQINNDSDFVLVKNFVDVDITNTNDDGAVINVLDAKRGHITTADGDDTISITTFSNSASWSNTFNINSGDGDDSITLTASTKVPTGYTSANSQYTSFHIEAGAGDDSVNVSGLKAPVSSAVSRVVDGGEGLDTLTLSGDDSVSFSNFEVVIGTEKNFGTSITVDSDLLVANASEFGLVFSNVDVSFDSGTELVVSSMLSDAQTDYLDSLGLDASDYASLTTYVNDHAYTVFTDDHSYTMPV